jgi:hypothetical protein
MRRGPILTALVAITALPTLTFEVGEVGLALMGALGVPIPSRNAFAMAYFLGGVFGPFATAITVILGIVSFAVPGLSPRQRVIIAGIAATSAAVSIHIWLSFTTKFH